MKKLTSAKEENTLLVRRPIPKDGESMRGYALRIDYENTVRLFSQRLGNLNKARASLRDMEAATGRKLNFFCAGVFISEVGRIDITSEYFSEYRFPASWVSSKHRRICPCCLKEQGFMQGIWEIQVIESCLVHGCRLIDHCDTCDDLLDWTGGDLMTCRCGASLCDMKVLPVGPKRESLDKLLLERLYSNAKDKADQCMSTMMNLPPLRIEQSFASITVIAFHISRRITYAINLTNANDRSEQQADLTLRLINLGYPGIEAALFRVLGNEMQPLKPPDRAWLLCQDAHSREMFLSELFNFEKSIGTLQFVRETVLPAWDGAHRKWLSTLDQSLIEYVDSCDPKFTQRRGSEVRRKKFIKWSIWADPRRIRLIKRLGKWLRKQESRIENR